MPINPYDPQAPPTPPPSASNGSSGWQSDIQSMIAPFQKIAQQYSSPYATMSQNSWLAQNHPQIAGVMDNALLGAAMTQPGRTVGENISNVARGALESTQYRRDQMLKAQMLPYQMLQPQLAAENTMSEIDRNQAQSRQFNANADYSEGAKTAMAQATAGMRGAETNGFGMTQAVNPDGSFAFNQDGTPVMIQRKQVQAENASNNTNNQRGADTAANNTTRTGIDAANNARALQIAEMNGRIRQSIASSSQEIARFKAQQGTGKVSAFMGKAMQTYQGSISRLKSMQDSLQPALGGDQQAMMNLLMNHIGMTLGQIPGGRPTKAIIDEAQESAPLGDRINARFDSHGLLTGVVLTPDQMKSMIQLGANKLRYDSDNFHNLQNFMGPQGGPQVNGDGTVTPSAPPAITPSTSPSSNSLTLNGGIPQGWPKAK